MKVTDLKRLTLVLGLSFALAGCVQTSEMQMAQNVYRIDVSTGGIGANQRASQETTKKAAALTLSKGYTHFIIADASMNSSVHTIGSTPITAHRIGNMTTFSGGTPINQRIATSSVTVVMFREGEAGARNAIDARTVPQT